MNELFTKEFDSDEDDEDYVPDKKELEEFENKPEIKKEVNKNKIDDLWNKLKNKNKIENPASTFELSDKNSENKLKPDNKLSFMNNSNLSIAKNNAKLSLDEQIQQAINKSKELKNKITTETVHFAGQKYEYQKVQTEEELKKQKEKDKKKTHSGLDSIVDSLERKNNVNTYTKSKKDWSNYVEEKQIQKELDYNRKDGFLQRKQFIEETNQKLIENKKNIKRQKTDMEN
jgi:hypothetical protein